MADLSPFDGFTLIYLRDAGGEFELELTVNEGTSDDLIGDAYGQLAVSVTDIERLARGSLYS